MAGLTALFGSAPEKSQDSEKLLHLYRNRAELKKEFANMRKEQYRLKDRIRQQEGATARLQQKALYRADSDAVPIAGTVTTMFDIGEDGSARRSEVNLLGENYWGIARILSR